MKCYELLEQPEQWTQAALARDSSGDIVEVNDPKACRWCVEGAIQKCYPSDLFEVVREFAKQTKAPFISIWNDKPTRTHAEVVAAFRAIDR